MNDLKMVRIKSEEPEKRVEIEIPLKMAFETKNRKPA